LPFAFFVSRRLCGLTFRVQLTVAVNGHQKSLQNEQFRSVLAIITPLQPDREEWSSPLTAVSHQRQTGSGRKASRTPTLVYRLAPGARPTRPCRGPLQTPGFLLRRTQPLGRSLQSAFLVITARSLGRERICAAVCLLLGPGCYSWSGDSRSLHVFGLSAPAQTREA
jgi:hypothetical protein